ncbi:hypothetical protein [Kitasatospora sp. NPDC086791]|uniref:hypothetical protein n=1 Tax=Kitasatospora sp. NPDC086791 TaxID=3155178 RepID=UPI00341521B4
MSPTDETTTPPYLTLGANNAVWRWHIGHLTVDVHTHSLGVLEWTVWMSDGAIHSEFEHIEPGIEAAQAHIDAYRRTGVDILRANRALGAKGWTRAFHTENPNCNCADCQP